MPIHWQSKTASLQAAMNWVDEATEHSRTDNVRAFARGKVLIRTGGNDHIADALTVTLSDGGSRPQDIYKLNATSVELKNQG